MANLKPFGSIIMFLAIIPILYSFYLITQNITMEGITPFILTSVALLIIGAFVRAIPKKT
jgi:hypothetical protein